MSKLTVNMTLSGIRSFPLPAAIPGDSEAAHEAIERLVKLGLVDYGTAGHAHRRRRHLASPPPRGVE